jgi:hypothetical protein
LAGESPTMHQQNRMNHSTTSRITDLQKQYQPQNVPMKAGRTSSQLCEMSSEARKVPHPIPRYTYLLWVIKSPINQLQVYIWYSPLC